MLMVDFSGAGKVRRSTADDNSSDSRWHWSIAAQLAMAVFDPSPQHWTHLRMQHLHARVGHIRRSLPVSIRRDITPQRRKWTFGVLSEEKVDFITKAVALKLTV